MEEDEWAFYTSGSEGPEPTRIHGEKARMLLTEGFNDRVPDLKDVDLPGLKLMENYADIYEIGPFPPAASPVIVPRCRSSGWWAGRR